MPFMPHSPTGGFQQLLLEPVLKFHYMLKKLQLHKEEYVLMQAISLFSPGDDPTWPVRPLPHRPPLPHPWLAHTPPGLAIGGSNTPNPQIPHPPRICQLAGKAQRKWK